MPKQLYLKYTTLYNRQFVIWFGMMMEAVDLIGKFVVVYVAGGDCKYPTIMVINHVDEIAGRLFLSGSQPKELSGTHNWLGEVETHMAWDNVAQFHVFDNYESFQDATSNQQGGGLFDWFRKS